MRSSSTSGTPRRASRSRILHDCSTQVVKVTPLRAAAFWHLSKILGSQRMDLGVERSVEVGMGADRRDTGLAGQYGV